MRKHPPPAPTSFVPPQYVNEMQVPAYRPDEQAVKQSLKLFGASTVAKLPSNVSELHCITYCTPLSSVTVWPLSAGQLNAGVGAVDVDMTVAEEEKEEVEGVSCPP